MKKKFAFLLMGNEYDPPRHQACFETEKGISYLCAVRNPEEAKTRALELVRDGVGAIELCGAFGQELARELIAITENKVAVGYVVHDPEQDELFSRFFS